MWLTELWSASQERYISRSRLPAVSREEKEVFFFSRNKSLIDQTCSAKIARQIYIGLVFFCSCMDLNSALVHKHATKITWLISSQHDRTSLVNNPYLVCCPHNGNVFLFLRLRNITGQLIFIGGASIWSVQTPTSLKLARDLIFSTWSKIILNL